MAFSLTKLRFDQAFVDYGAMPYAVLYKFSSESDLLDLSETETSQCLGIVMPSSEYCLGDSD